MNIPSSGPEGIDGNIHTNWLDVKLSSVMAHTFTPPKVSK
jgi:hypothetical protein